MGKGNPTYRPGELPCGVVRGHFVVTTPGRGAPDDDATATDSHTLTDDDSHGTPASTPTRQHDTPQQETD